MGERGDSWSKMEGERGSYPRLRDEASLCSSAIEGLEFYTDRLFPPGFLRTSTPLIVPDAV